jgi:hypothetical protein
MHHAPQAIKPRPKAHERGGIKLALIAWLIGVPGIVALILLLV